MNIFYVKLVDIVEVRNFSCGNISPAQQFWGDYPHIASLFFDLMPIIIISIKLTNKDEVVSHRWYVVDEKYQFNG